MLKAALLCILLCANQSTHVLWYKQQNGIIESCMRDKYAYMSWNNMFNEFEAFMLIYTRVEMGCFNWRGITKYSIIIWWRRWWKVTAAFSGMFFLHVKTWQYEKIYIYKFQVNVKQNTSQMYTAIICYIKVIAQLHPPSHSNVTSIALMDTRFNYGVNESS